MLHLISTSNNKVLPQSKMYPKVKLSETQISSSNSILSSRRASLLEVQFYSKFNLELNRIEILQKFKLEFMS